MNAAVPFPTLTCSGTLSILRTRPTNGMISSWFHESFFSGIAADARVMYLFVMHRTDLTCIVIIASYLRVC